MADKRLSRLQRWILIEALRKGPRNLDDPFDDKPNTECEMKKAGLGHLVSRYWIGTRDVHRRFYRLPTRVAVLDKQSVSLSRSLTTLERQGYIERYHHGRHYVGIKIALSDLGVKVAKQMIDTEREPLIQ